MKNMLSLRSYRGCKSVHQLKEEMTVETYEDDGYYFLEAYIDGMMEGGSYGICNY
jgi:hypothetical protein